MAFVSITYILFVSLLFLIYWQVKAKAIRNLILLVASYIFYGWWDARFLILIVASSLLDYYCGRQIERHQDNRQIGKIYLWISLGFNLGVLGLFKYFNFFVDSFYLVLDRIAIAPADPVFINILLPVGISFYTFQTLSYTIDIYRQQLKPTNSLLEFMTFVSFFPQLVAGPIERARDLLPQFNKLQVFDYSEAVAGCQQILWGTFKKTAIADPLGIQIVNPIYNNLTTASAPEIAIATVAFAFQIYGDFSGYSDIAIGTAKLFGFRLSRNFARPYLSKNTSEFWRRWHISLSSWFRDYVYIPLGGNRQGINRTVANLLITFGLSGLWHGANWTFVIWGLLNGLFLLPQTIWRFLARSSRERTQSKDGINYLKNTIDISVTFVLICISWIFFRADNLTQAGIAIQHLFGTYNLIPGLEIAIAIILNPENIISLGCLSILIATEISSELNLFKKLNIARTWRWSTWAILLGIIMIQSRITASEFIYFQF